MLGRGACVLAFVIACGPKPDRTVPPGPGSNATIDPPIDATIAGTPADSAMRPIEDLPEALRANLPTVSIEGTEALLAYVAARLTAPGSIGARVIAADAIAAGAVTRSEVIPHPPSKAFLADPALQAHAPDGPGGRMLFVAVVDVSMAYEITIKAAADAVNAQTATPFNEPKKADAIKAAKEAVAAPLDAKLAASPAKWRAMLRTCANLTRSGRDASKWHSFDYFADGNDIDFAAKTIKYKVLNNPNVGTTSSAALIQIP